LACGVTTFAAPTLAAQTPAVVANELLAADHRFSSAGSKGDLVTSLSAMFADGVLMPAPPGRFARGKAEAVDVLKANPANSGARAEWTPVRVGVSGDGLHGFTFGYMTVRRTDGTTTTAKYLAYWVKGPGGWRVAAYKRGARPDSAIAITMLPAALRARAVAPTTARSVIDRHYASLVKAESDFSDLAQRIGLGPAFRDNGRTDAMNLGGPTSAAFVIGNEAIGALIGGARPQPVSPVVWSADTAIVASSGDLGVTIGFIRQKAPGADGTTPPPTPFFTIWWRDGPGAPWKYIAE
jgi:ketosteroid isomerase-like protein